MVDFASSIRKPTVQSRLENKAANLPVRELAAPQSGSLIYFRASFPSTGFVLHSGERFKFGSKIPYWHVTSVQEEISYLRDFVNAKDTGFTMEELDIHIFDAATTITKEYLPPTTTTAELENLNSMKFEDIKEDNGTTEEGNK